MIRTPLCDLLGIMKDKTGKSREEAAALVMKQLDSFCDLVRRARDSNEFLGRRLVSIETIYRELSAVFEAAKKGPQGKNVAVIIPPPTP